MLSKYSYPVKTHIVPTHVAPRQGNGEVVQKDQTDSNTPYYGKLPRLKVEGLKHPHSELVIF